MRNQLKENEHVDIAYNDEYLKELKELKIESEILKSSLEDANKAIVKFVDSEKNLNMLLSQQKLILDKGGIGYYGKRKDRTYKSYFVRATHNTCNYCGRMRHIAHTCSIRKSMNGKGKEKYV